MKFRESRWVFLIGGIILVCVALVAMKANFPFAERDSTSLSDMVVTNLRDTTFTLSWITDQDSSAEVHYGSDPENLDQTAFDLRGAEALGDTHYVVVAGLTPSTSYYFDIQSGADVDDNGGSHYTATTGPTISLPSVDTSYGRILESDGSTPASGCILAILLQDANGAGSPGESAVQSSLSDENGYWFTNLASARLADLSGYFQYTSSGDLKW